MRKLLTYFNAHKIPPIFRNLFFLTSVSFVVWMLFLDDNNLINQYKLKSELSTMEDKMDFYKAEAEKAENQYYALMDDEQYAIRFAREKYWMKKPNEEVFIVLSPSKEK